MKNPLGFIVATLATTSLVLAGGEDEKKGGKKTAKPTTPSFLQGTWSGGAGQGIKYSSADFAIKLLSTLQVQVVYNSIDSGADTAGVVLRRARTTLSGHVYNKDITYKVQNDWSTATSVKDAYVDWRFHNTDSYDLSVRMGQMKTRFGKEHNSSHSKLEFIDRSRTTKIFSNVRTRAAMLHGSANQGALSWGLSISNGDMAGAANNSGEEGDTRGGTALNDDTDNEANYTVDVAWSSNPKAVRMGGTEGALDDESGFGCGIAYFLGNGQSNTLAGATDTDTETDSTNVWAAFKSAGIAGSAEYFARNESQTGVSDARSEGYVASVSWTSRKIPDQDQWGFGLRYSHAELGLSAAGHGQRHLTGGVLGGLQGREVNELEFVVNMFHHGHNLKTQAGVTYQNIADDNVAVAGGNSNGDNYLFGLQSTLIF